MIEIILGLLLGIFVGTITGLIPGIHINLVGGIAVSSAAVLSGLSPIGAVAFIVSISITHTFIDFIPSIFLGSSNEETGLSVLPGHEFLKRGRAQEAIALTVIGGLIGLIILIILTPLFIFILPRVYTYFNNVMFFILIFISLFMIFIQERKFLAFIIFMMAGFLGIASFQLQINQPLLPLLTGLFGGSSVFLSIIHKVKIPKQKKIPLRNLIRNKKDYLESAGAIALSSPLVSFLPGLGSGQAAIIGSTFIEENNRKNFMVLLGGINTLVMGLSFVVLYSIGKARSGSAVFISSLLENMSLNNLWMILVVTIISGILAAFLSLKLSGIFSRIIVRISYRIISVIVMLFLISLIFFISGPLGLIIFITSTALGIFTSLSEIRKTNLMGSIMLQTILYYTPF